jgi:acrylyl-CoA reductase (NADPH)
MHRSLFLENDDSGFRASLRELDDDALKTSAGTGDVVVRISHSTLNYKDGLAITNRSPVVRKWPMVPGIDGAGVVEHSDDPRWKAGDAVILNGWGVGETHWGCLAGKARLKGDWLIAMPTGMNAAEAMAIGTAGYTAMLCAMALERQGVRPDQGEVLVTGAAGGVGSIAVAILAARGFRVIASTGRPDEADYLKSLGASEVIERGALSAPGKPLQRERWAGVVDAVGSHTLANACAQTRYRGTVAACGLAQGLDFPASVAPFILRGIRLIGIDSVMCPKDEREQAWAALADELDRSRLATISRSISLADAIPAAAEVLAGRIRGRLVVDVDR